MTPSEKLKVFKEVTRGYPKYLEHIRKIDDQLKLLQIKMENVHSVSFDQEISVPSFSDRPMIEMIEQKSLLEDERNKYRDLIGWINEVIDSFESPAIKALVWATYIQGNSLTSIADKCLISKDNLYKIRKKHLDRVLNEDTMHKLKVIQQNISLKLAK